MPDRNRSKRPHPRLISHNLEGLTESEHVRSSSSTDRPRQSSSSNSFGHESIPSKSASRHSSSRSSRCSRSISRSPRNSRRTSVSSVLVEPNGQRQADEDVVPAWAKLKSRVKLVSSNWKRSYINQTNVERWRGQLSRNINLIRPFTRNSIR